MNKFQKTLDKTKANHTTLKKEVAKNEKALAGIGSNSESISKLENNQASDKKELEKSIEKLLTKLQNATKKNK